MEWTILTFFCMQPYGKLYWPERVKESDKKCLEMQADLRLCYLHYAIGTFVLINKGFIGGSAMARVTFLAIKGFS